MAAASTAWAVSMSVNNYRLVNITDRLNSHENHISNAATERGEIREVLATIVEQNRTLNGVLTEIKQDLKNTH